MSDSTVIFVLTIFFIALGVLLPLVQGSFDDVVVTENQNVEDVNQNFLKAQGETTPVGLLDIAWSVITMFFWSINGIPILIELIFLLPLRIWYFYILLKDVIVNLIPLT